LNKLPEVKGFITEDLEALYTRTEYKKVPGASPIAIFYNQAGEEVERLGLTELSRDELNDLMVAKGIPKKPETVEKIETLEHDEI